MRSWADVEKFSASLRIFSALSSSWPSFSPRSTISLCALLISLVVVVTLEPISCKLPGICFATDLFALPLDSPNNSSLSRDRTPPPKRPLKKLSLGASGMSNGKNSSPIISVRFEQNSVQSVNFCNSDGEVKYNPCPLLLKQNVRAILKDF
jgi:hypothetical protein